MYKGAVERKKVVNLLLRDWRWRLRTVEVPRLLILDGAVLKNAWKSLLRLCLDEDFN